MTVTRDEDTEVVAGAAPKWSLICLHHTATSKETTVEQIRNYHVKTNGWRDIGYNWLVDYKGYVFEGRPLTISGAHCLDYNSVAIGIAAIGDFDKGPMPDVQKQAIAFICKKMMDKYGISKIKLHRELNSTDCPGKNFPVNDIYELIKKGSGDVGESTEKWQQEIMDWARAKKLITSPDHTALETAPKWFVLEIARRVLVQVEETEKRLQKMLQEASK